MKTTTAPLPYWRLSGFYGFYFASLGILLPYWTLYLKSLTFDAKTIGILMAILAATRIISPSLWGWLADHIGQRMLIVRWASLVTFLIFLGVFVNQSVYWLGLVIFGFSFFWNASLPQVEAITLHYLGDDSHRYGQIRLWGSIGFILSVILLGQAITLYSINVIPWVLGACFFGIFAVSLSIKDSDRPHPHHSDRSLRQVLAQPAVIVLFITAFLSQASHAPYYTFYSIYLETHNYPATTISYLWSIGVVAEISLFVIMHHLSRFFSVGQLLRLSLLLACLRWLLMGLFVDEFAVIYGIQLLHAGTFAIYHAAAMRFLQQHFAGQLQGQGQALYSSVSFGAGGAVGAFGSGYLWAIDPLLAFGVASGLGFIGYLLVLKWIHD